MRCVPKYRVNYHGEFYEAGREFCIDEKDAEEMKRHGTVLDEPAPPPAAPKKLGRPRRAENGQLGSAKTTNK